MTLIDPPAPATLRRGAEALAAQFAAPDPARYGPVPIWWWSGATLTRERLRWQMEQLVSQGVSQAVILNLAPTGPLYGALADDPPFMSEAWWAIFLGACEDAHELGFRFWPYDQIGFSGANLQGKIVTAHPEWAGQALGRSQLDLALAGRLGQSLASPYRTTALAAYVTAPGSLEATAVDVVDNVARTGAAEGVLTVVYSVERGFDYFDTGAVAALMDTVHGEFFRRAGRWFGSVITGFFQDELPAMPTWGKDFLSTFEARHGYDLRPHLGALWDDPTPGSPAAPAVRLDFNEHRAHLAARATFEPLSAWFAAHDLICGFDQQSPAREGDPAGATKLYGNYLSLAGSYGAPGSDHWGDSKVHSSVAHSGGKPRTWLEAFHSSGWGGTLEETYDWLAPFLRRGATLYNPHAVYYATPGSWWEWAPPSTCWRQPYWPQYHLLAGAVARLSELFTTGDHVADTVLLFPTSTVQAGVTIDAQLPGAEQAGRVYHALNGTPAWYAERPGVLDRSGHDYDILDEVVLGAGVVGPDGITVGRETFRNVVVPCATALRADCAGTLVDLAEAGGTVVFVGAAPTWFPGDDVAGRAGARVRRALERGSISQVPTSEGVPALLGRAAVWVDADVPTLLRRSGDAWVIGLFAHDGQTGTKQPIITGGGSGIEWIETTWDAYWAEITATGYEYRPVTGRRARGVLHGASDLRLEQWDPVTGRRAPLAGQLTADGALHFEIAFDHGTIALVVASPAEPGEPSAIEPAAGRAGSANRTGCVVETPLTRWTVEAQSRLDNRWGDFGAADRRGVLPIEVWELELGEGADPVAWTPVTATYGPFARSFGPAASAEAEPWTVPGERDFVPVSWSLSRGIEKDPVHGDSLGPKGYVPEEFLLWPTASAGEWVATRTSIDVPPAPAGLALVVGANATKHVLLDGAVVATDGAGYSTSTPIAPGRHDLEIWLQAERTERIRASFAVVSDLAAFRRPEWLEPAQPSAEPSTWLVTHTLALDAVPPDARIQVGTEQPCTVLVNGVEVGRQSDFDPYGERRFGRLHPYDLTSILTTGTNVIELRSLEGARAPAVLVDSIPAARGGLGVMTGVGEWESRRDELPTPLRMRPQQWQDPRFVSLQAKPHPLPGAHWLEPIDQEGVVVLVIPDLDPGDHSPQQLRFALPIGTTSLVVPSTVPFEGAIAGMPVKRTGCELHLSAPTSAGEIMTLTFQSRDGRRGGAVLDAAITVQTSPVAAELLDWSDLGLGSMAGDVTYTTTLTRGAAPAGGGGRAILDLGEVRGSVSVRIDGAEAGELAWSPYRLDVSGLVAAAPPGTELELQVVVRNTLAGFMTSASPTPAVFAGQVRAGLRGPVRLLEYGPGEYGPGEYTPGEYTQGAGE